MRDSLVNRLLVRVLLLVCALAGGCGEVKDPVPEDDIRRAVAIYLCETAADGTSSKVVEVLKPATTGPALKAGDTLRERSSKREFIAEHKRRVVMFWPAEPYALEVFRGGRADKPLYDEKVAYYGRMPLAEFRALCMRVNALP